MVINMTERHVKLFIKNKLIHTFVDFPENLEPEDVGITIEDIEGIEVVRRLFKYGRVK